MLKPRTFYDTMTTRMQEKFFVAFSIKVLDDYVKIITLP